MYSSLAPNPDVRPELWEYKRESTPPAPPTPVSAKRHLFGYIAIVLKSLFLLELVVYRIVVRVGHAGKFEVIFFLTFVPTLGTQSIALSASMFLLIYVVLVNQ